MMKRELRDAWVKRLRAGHYKQLCGKLRDEGTGRCCLGVLCDTVRLDQGLGRWDMGEFYLGEYSEDSELPHGMLEHVGLTTKRQNTLIKMNDRDIHTFEEIADKIETWKVKD